MNRHSMSKDSQVTIRFLKASKKYQVRVKMPDGTRPSHGTFSTLREAQKKQKELEVDLGRGDYWDESPGRTPFEQFALEYMEGRRADVSEGTYRNWRSLLKTTLLPTFAKHTVGSISIRVVDRWWAGQAAHPVNRRNAYFFLKKMMKYAVRWGYIRENPCQVEEAGKDVAERRPMFAEHDFDRVVEAMPETYRVVMLVAFSAHLRIGEVCGLLRGDYDSATGHLLVERQDNMVGGRHLTKTKTGNSRTVLLLDDARDALNDYCNSRVLAPDSALFTGAKGGRLSQPALRKAWVTARELVGLPDFHFHDVKRVSLTFLARAGVSTKGIMARGGHSSYSAALRYQDYSREMDEHIAAVASELRKKILNPEKKIRDDDSGDTLGALV